MKALPVTVAPKNVEKGIKKWPQVIPAKSNRGLGMDAHNRTVKNAFFYNFSYIRTFILAINVSNYN